jgi:pyrimidine-specific ribonucleoside hydrolase
VRPIIIDVDTGTDDALAILYAVRHPDLDVRGISCVIGNVSVDQAVINTCKVLDAASAGDIPVAAGAAQPLIEHARREGGGSHGPDGLAGIQLSEPLRHPSPMHAVDLLHQLIMASAEPVSLVSLAPKTNLALLLTSYPDIATRLEQIIFMGGSASETVAEFNVWQDPEAARLVLESSVPITMYGLDLFDRLVVNRADVGLLRTHDHPAIWLAGELLHRRNVRHNDSDHEQLRLLGDAGAMVLLTNPELFVIEERNVAVQLQGAGRGQTELSEASAPRAQLGADKSESRIRFAADLDATKAASAFVETIYTYAASGKDYS